MKRFAVAVAAAVATVIQVLWASPDAPSAIDPSESPWVYLPWLCLPAMPLAAMAWSYGRRLPPVWRTLLAGTTMTGYWVLLDVYEFSTRVAAWSTFSTSSLWLHTLRNAAVPLLVCSAVFALCVYWLSQRMPASAH